MKLAYLGPEGTFSEEAALLHDRSAELVPCGSHLEVIQAVLHQKADKGVLARENSIGGSVIDVVDPLLKNPIGIKMERSLNGRKILESRGPLMLCGEVQVPIVQCLYMKPGTVLEEVQIVYSHPQGLAQCRERIAVVFPKAKVVETRSTVAAVPEILVSSAPAAAIAPRRAGDLYPQAQRVGEGFEDYPLNTTRFVVLGHCDNGVTERDKTSLWFTVPEDEKPGTLDNVSQILALAKLNKRVIESRPLQGEPGKYVFLVDVDGHRLGKVMQLALELIVLAGHTNTLTILGSYPRWTNGDN